MEGFAGRPLTPGPAVPQDPLPPGPVRQPPAAGRLAAAGKNEVWHV